MILGISVNSQGTVIFSIFFYRLVSIETIKQLIQNFISLNEIKLRPIFSINYWSVFSSFRAIMALFSLAVSASQTLSIINYENLSLSSFLIYLNDIQKHELFNTGLEGGARVAPQLQ